MQYLYKQWYNHSSKVGTLFDTKGTETKMLKASRGQGMQKLNFVQYECQRCHLMAHNALNFHSKQ